MTTAQVTPDALAITPELLAAATPGERARLLTLARALAERGRATDPVAWIMQTLGEHLWSKQREIARALVQYRRVAVPACHSSGKCAVKSAMIVLADGRVVQAGDLAGRQFAILTVDPETGAQRAALARAESNGTKPTWRITTTGGRQIERTGNHPLYVARKLGGGGGQRMTIEQRGWVEIDKLELGDLVMVPERLEVTGRRPMPLDDVKFAGYMLGDGSTIKYVGFTQQDGPAKDEFVEIIKRYGGQVRVAGKYGLRVVGAAGERFHRKESNAVLNRLRDWGMLGTMSRNKRLPAWAWELPNEQLAVLLNRLFACDGWATARVPAAGSHVGLQAQIGIRLASKGMIRDIELAMLRFGIVGVVRQCKGTLNGKSFYSWEWQVHRLEDLERFQECIGIFGKEAAVSRAVAAKRGISEERRRPRNWMRRNAPKGYRWEAVKAIEPLGEQETVAIEVAGTHTYLTTFVEHNSHLASRLMAWWISASQLGDAFVVSTAPTYAQVRAILWRYVGQLHARHNLPGRVTQTEWWINRELVGFGRKPADAARGTEETSVAFQGIHARRVLVLLDEAGGVPSELWVAADSLVTNPESRILAIGNPDSPNTEFARVCQPGSGYHVINIDGLETPNLTGEEVPDSLRPLLLSELWVEEKRATWGESSPLWLSKVRGQFPEESADKVTVPLSFVRRAQVERSYQRDITGKEVAPELLPVELGVDVGGGGDATVIRERRGQRVGRVWRSWSGDPMADVGKVVQAIRETGATRVKVDVIGVGYAFAGRLAELAREGAHRAQVESVNVANKSSEPARFALLRDELWWMAREACEQGRWDLTGLDDDTIAQLIAPEYTIDSSGRIKVEPKDETRRKLGRSPDDADALLLAYGRGQTRSRRVVSW